MDAKTFSARNLEKRERHRSNDVVSFEFEIVLQDRGTTTDENAVELFAEDDFSNITSRGRVVRCVSLPFPAFVISGGTRARSGEILTFPLVPNRIARFTRFHPWRVVSPAIAAMGSIARWSPSTDEKS